MLIHSLPASGMPTLPAAGRSSIRRHPFTIIELMVVIGTILILMAMLIPALTKSREKAKRGRWEGYMRNQRVQEKMVLQYMFLEPIGASTFDNTAQGIDVEGYNRDDHHGTPNNIVWDEGRWFSKHAPRFNGISSTISSKPLKVVDPHEHAYTAIAWIYPHGSGACTILGNEGAGNNGVNLGLDGSGHLETIAGGSTVTGNLQVEEDMWTMVAIVQNEDGLTIHKLTDAGHEQELLTASTHENLSVERPFLIGSQSSDGLMPYSNGFDGLIDEISIYSRALPDAELSDAFKMGAP